MILLRPGLGRPTPLRSKKATSSLTGRSFCVAFSLFFFLHPFLHCCFSPAAACFIVYVHSRIQPPRNGSRLGDESGKMAAPLSFLVVCEVAVRPFSFLERATQADSSVCRLFSFLPFFFSRAAS